MAGYEYLNLPFEDVRGLLLRRHDPLANREFISVEDLAGINLICSSQELVMENIRIWSGRQNPDFNIVATYTLLYNAAQLVSCGVGAAICLDGIADTSPQSCLVFRHFRPALKAGLTLAWKKHSVFY